MTQALTQAYVFARDPLGNPVLAGTMVLNQTSGSFTYASSWLTQDWAYSLDPVNLPLSAAPNTTRNQNRVHPVFSDAGPDDWGTQVLLAGHSRLPANEIERLLATSGHGVGCLQFSLSRSQPKAIKPVPDIELLEELQQTALLIVQNKPVEPTLLAILMPASSLGGARPKVTLRDGDQLYLAKFSRPNDPFNTPRVEYATMLLARKCGISIPDVSLRKAGESDVFLIRRFDRTDNQRQHYISAHSLFNRERIRLIGDAYHDPYSYIALARIIRTHCSDWRADCLELYRRILFNVIVGNTDDHARNHGLIFDPANPGWKLSPAFDLLPIISGAQQHALGIGKSGRLRSLENVLTAAPGFGIDESLAQQLLDQLIDQTADWQLHFRECEVSDEDVQRLQMIIRNFPS